MCRMLFAAGKIPLKAVIEGMQLISKDLTQIHEFNLQKGLGSWVHSDGWGFAYLKNKSWKVKKSTAPFFKDKTALEKISKNSPKNLLLHVRKTSGSRVALSNTHPFLRREKKMDYVFCHNGKINTPFNFNKDYSPMGETDSERLFYSILTEFSNQKSLSSALRDSLKQYPGCRGSNFILATPEKTYLALGPSELKEYFTMHISSNPSFLIISSEPLPTLKNLNWQKVLPGTILVIDNQTREVRKI